MDVVGGYSEGVGSRMMWLVFLLVCIWINAFILYEYIWLHSTKKTVFLETGIAMSLVFEVLGNVRYRYGIRGKLVFVAFETFDVKYANEIVLRSFKQAKMKHGIVTRANWKRVMNDMYVEDVETRGV